MLAAKNKQQTLETNVVYLEDKPLKIIKKRKLTVRKKSRILNMEDCIDIKSNKNMEGEQDEETINLNDPLYTPAQIKVECEFKKDKIEINEEYEEEDVNLDSEKDEDFCIDEYEENDTEGEEEDDQQEDYKIKNIRKKIENKKEKCQVSSKEDEPLILITKTRPTTYQKKTPNLRSCSETCKYKCTINFNMQQRFDIFQCYRNLSKEDKMNFIRQHARKPILTKIRINSEARQWCCYFLKHYTPNQNPIIKESETDTNDNDLIKVCRLFFESTLRVSYLRIKQAIEGYELKKEQRILPPKKYLIKNKDENITKEIEKKPQLFLDPETGNLTDTKPKTKRPKAGETKRKRFPKPVNCHIKCKFKCHEKFTEEERQQICNTFWSLDYKRRKDYILTRLEKKELKSVISEEFRTSNRNIRSYQTKMFLRSSINGENIRVCNDFTLKTLCITRDFIENAIKFADEITGLYTGTDRRGGASATTIKHCEERKKLVVDHISSYPFWVPSKKSKTKYLHHSLTIKKLYDDYKEKCLKQQKKFTSTFYYYTTFHKEFRLAFLTSSQQKTKAQLANHNISHYTGEESGGYWVDIKDNKLDMKFINPAQCLKNSQQNCSVSASTNVVDNSATSPSSRIVARSDLNISLYENLSKFYKNV